MGDDRNCHQIVLMYSKCRKESNSKDNEGMLGISNMFEARQIDRKAKYYQLLFIWQTRVSIFVIDGVSLKDRESTGGASLICPLNYFFLKKKGQKLKVEMSYIFLFSSYIQEWVCFNLVEFLTYTPFTLTILNLHPFYFIIGYIYTQHPSKVRIWTVLIIKHINLSTTIPLLSSPLFYILLWSI